MTQNCFHGIPVNLSFDDASFPTQFRTFAKKIAGDWVLYGIIVDNDMIPDAIRDIQSHFRSDENFYAHLYNDEDLIVIFKDRYFKVTSHISRWGKIIEYGQKLGIVREQLDFWPNRFQDEIHYFNNNG